MDKATYDDVLQAATARHGDADAYETSRQKVFAYLVEVLDVYVTLGEMERIQKFLDRQGKEYTFEQMLDAHNVSRPFMGLSELNSSLQGLRENLVMEYSEEGAGAVNTKC